MLDVSLPYGTSGRINHYFQFYYICNLRFSIYSIKRTSIDIEFLYLGVLILIIHIISYRIIQILISYRKISSGGKVELDGGKSEEKWLFIFCCISNNLATSSSIKKSEKTRHIVLYNTHISTSCQDEKHNEWIILFW